MRRTARAFVVAIATVSMALALAGGPVERDRDGSAGASVKPVMTNAPALPDELLVKVRPGGAIPLNLVDRLLAAEEVGRLDTLGVVRLKIGRGIGVDLAARIYASLPFVQYAEPNYILRPALMPNDPMYGAYQRWYYELIEAPEAWDLDLGAHPAVVAVLDTGVDVSHPDLADNIWMNQGETAANGVDDDDNGCVDDVHGCNFVDPKTADIACVGRPRGPSSDVSDADGHGTFVAGTIAARTDNEQGVAGTADGVVLMPVKVLACTGGGAVADIVAGILYAAENGAQVINMSFGGHLESDAIGDAIRTAHDDFGVVLVAASGNSGFGEVAFPASLPEVIAVGASDRSQPDERARFSSWGPEVDVAAPGVDIASTVPEDLCGRNWSCIGTLPYSKASGTSFAAPQVAGLAALLLSRSPALSNEDVREIIRTTALPLPDSGSANWAGAGRIRIKEALEFNPDELPAGGLGPGCSMTTLTFPAGTDAAAVAAAVSPPGALDAIWRLDNASGSFQAFAADAPQASDLTSVDLLDAVFLCLNAAADVDMPTVSADPSGASISTSLSARCNAVGLSFPDGTTPAQVADAISPSAAFTSMWRLETESGSFQAYAAAAPQASDLTSLQFLDAVFVCMTAPASLSMPAVEEVPVGAPSPIPTPATPRAGATVGSGEPNCRVFPADNPWNTDISSLPVDARSDAYIDAIGRDDGLHPDFGTEYEGAPNGIPFVVVSGSQPPVPISFDYADESDPGPYPIPPDAPIEGGAQSDGDRHVLVIDDDNCVLYEVFDAHPVDGGQSWTAGSGAVFDLSSNDLRPDYWTSADAAGLPIFPGLVRYGEVIDEGIIDHALRFTVEETQRAFIHPATHFASDDTNPNLPPMGLRFRMKPSYDCSGLSQEVQVICAALKKYGMFVADNGGNWFISGAPDMRWSDDNLADLKEITGDAFEVVDTGEQIITE